METKNLSQSNQTIIELFRRGYRCDDYGNVIKPDGTYQKMCASSLGYKRFALNYGGKSINILAHRFIMFCRVGDKLFTKGLKVLHKNDDGFDNSSGNLYLGTSKDNGRDAINNNKLIKRGTYKHLYLEIYNHYLLFGQKKTVNRYRITQRTLRNIINRIKSGKHTTSSQISIPF